jgi:selenide,water dikinase
MKQLNRHSARAAIDVGAHAMTDITGFGLLGHAQEMASQSGVDFHFSVSALPWLPGVRRYAEAGAFPGGMGRNLAHFSPFVRFDERVDELMRDMLWTPETSGGLLVAIKAEELEAYVAQVPQATPVGEVREGDGLLYVHE